MLSDLDKLPHGPNWMLHKIRIVAKNGDVRMAYLFGRNIIAIVRTLIGDTNFKDKLRYAPVQVWTTIERKVQVYSEAWTGRWWWRMQVSKFN